MDRSQAKFGNRQLRLLRNKATAFCKDSDDDAPPTELVDCPALALLRRGLKNLTGSVASNALEPIGRISKILTMFVAHNSRRFRWVKRSDAPWRLWRPNLD